MDLLTYLHALPLRSSQSASDWSDAWGINSLWWERFMNYDPGLEQKVVDDGKATTKSRLWKCDGMANRRFLGRLQTQGQHCSKIMKPPQSLPLQMAERLL